MPEEEKRAPLHLRLLGCVFILIALGAAGTLFNDELASDGIALAIMFGLGGWALLAGRRWGYWIAVLITVLHFAGAVYLLVFSRERYEWAGSIGVWVFLVPACALALLVALPSSRRWATGTNAKARR